MLNRSKLDRVIAALDAAVNVASSSVSEPKSDHTDLKALRAARDIIQEIRGLGLDLRNLREAIVLPENRTCFSEYRVVDDVDTEERAQWVECRDGNGALRLCGGDIVIRRSGRPL